MLIYIYIVNIYIAIEVGHIPIFLESKMDKLWPTELTDYGTRWGRSPITKRHAVTGQKLGWFARTKTSAWLIGYDVSCKYVHTLGCQVCYNPRSV